jgi:hypothetical protein
MLVTSSLMVAWTAKSSACSETPVKTAPKKSTWERLTTGLMWLLMAILLFPGSFIFIGWAITHLIAWLFKG